MFLRRQPSTKAAEGLRNLLKMERSEGQRIIDVSSSMSRRRFLLSIDGRFLISVIAHSGKVVPNSPQIHGHHVPASSTRPLSSC